MIESGLLDTARRLAGILAAENAALAAVDYAAAARLTADKRRAVDAFARASEAARATDRGAAPAARQEHAALRALGLPELAETNRLLLERALIVQRRVIEAFARAVPRTPVTPRYGARGALMNVARSAPVALSARA